MLLPRRISGDREPARCRIRRIDLQVSPDPRDFSAATARRLLPRRTMGVFSVKHRALISVSKHLSLWRTSCSTSIRPRSSHALRRHSRWRRIATAQQPGNHQPRKPGDLHAIRKVSTLIGTDVMNHTNTKIATLRDLALSRDGAVHYAIIGCGGVAGVGETYTAVPYDLLGVRNDDGKWSVNLDMTTENLKQAPTIKSENYHELLDPKWIKQVDQFVRIHGDSAHHPSRSSDVLEREHRSVERVLLATKIRSASVRNTGNQDLGRIEDLLLDRTDRVAFVIMARGGVLGIGENYIPVPWSKLSLGENRENAAVNVMIDATKSQLEKAPHRQGGQLCHPTGSGLRGSGP